MRGVIEGLQSEPLFSNRRLYLLGFCFEGRGGGAGGELIQVSYGSV